MRPPQQFYSIPDAAKALRVSSMAIRELVYAQNLHKGPRINRESKFIPRDVLERYAARTGRKLS